MDKPTKRYQAGRVAYDVYQPYIQSLPITEGFVNVVKKWINDIKRAGIRNEALKVWADEILQKYEAQKAAAMAAEKAKKAAEKAAKEAAKKAATPASK